MIEVLDFGIAKVKDASAHTQTAMLSRGDQDRELEVKLVRPA